MADFWRGVQSALFYYFACTPCFKYNTRKRRRKQNSLDRKERATQELDSPMLYRQPSPFATNQYWAEEIRMGPGPPPKRVSKKAKVAREQYLKQDPPVPVEEGVPAETSAMEGVKNILLQATGRKPSDGDRWNKKRYQREDEELWGLEEEDDFAEGESGTSASVGVTSNGVPGQPRFAAHGRSNESFYVIKNPPVNDLHPPVVSNPSSTIANNQWMLQPPPSAKVMNGYEQVNRNRSGSGTSSRKGGELALSQKMSHRIVSEKMKKVEMSYIHDIPDTSPNNDRKEYQNQFENGARTAIRTLPNAGQNRKHTGSSTSTVNSTFHSTSPTKSRSGRDLTDSGIDVQDFLEPNMEENTDDQGDNFYDYAYSKNNNLIMSPIVRTKTIAATPYSVQSLKRLSRTHNIGDLEPDKNETRRNRSVAPADITFFDTLLPNAPDLDVTAGEFVAHEAWNKRTKSNNGMVNMAPSSAAIAKSPWVKDWYPGADDDAVDYSRDVVGVDWPTARSFRRWSVDF